MRSTAFVLALSAVAGLAVAPVAARAPDLPALRHLVGLREPQISPDGTRVAFVRTTLDFVHDKNRSTLSLVRATGGAETALTDGKEPVSSIRWSPRGDRLAYLSTGKNHNDQIFVVAATGGRPRALTDAKNDVEQFAWSPDGSRIAYVTQDEPADAAAFKRHDDLFDVHDDGYLTEHRPLPSHLWLVGTAGGAARRLTSGTWSVLENAAPFVGGPSDPSWSADGTAIVFARQPNADDSDSDKSVVAVADVRTGNVRALSDRTQYEYQPVFAPSGDRVAYLYPRGPGPISTLDVRLAPRSGGDGAVLTTALDRDVTNAVWMRDGANLLVTANDGIGAGLWLQPVDGGAARRLDLGSLVPGEFSVATRGSVAMTASDATHPAEIYVLADPAARPRQLTHDNAPVAAFDYGRTTELSWTAPDGERSDGVLTYPVGYVPGRTYPLVLRIHGGPEAASTVAYGTTRGAPFRVLAAARGYITFEPNYRGSDNLGSAHEHAIYLDPGAGPFADVMAGIDAVEKLGIVDPSRICVTGHSYGGYMTAWIESHDARWKCAIVSDGMIDWKAEYDLSSTGNLAWARDSLGGTPADAASAALYRDGSPITYVANVRTPTLIFSGTADATVPATESYELYHALADRNVPVRFVAIPTAHHFPSDPVRIERYYQITFDWLDRYLQPGR